MILVTGAAGMIGGALVSHFQMEGQQVLGTTRETLDLLDPGNLSRFGFPNAVYLCAGMTRFIDCETNPDAYRVNVDAQVFLAEEFNDLGAKIIYLSSEAVEKALHTNYGMHKALAEAGLRAVCKPVIARLGKVTMDTRHMAATWLHSLLIKQAGVYRWGT